MTADHDIELRYFNSDQTFSAQCTSLTGSSISFKTQQAVMIGKGLEIHVQTNNPANPYLTAYIETLNSTKQDENIYQINARIKIIKGN